MTEGINSQIGAMTQETREGFSHLASDINSQIGAMTQGARSVLAYLEKNYSFIKIGYKKTEFS